MKKIFLTGTILIILLFGNYGCSNDNGVVTDEGGAYVTFYYGLDVTAEWDHYPALNESAKISITFKFKDWFQDSLLSLGIESLELGPIYYVQKQFKDIDGDNSANEAFYPEGRRFLWSDDVSIYDTFTWNIEIKPLQEGIFDLSIGIGSITELDWQITEMPFVSPYGFDYICINIGENQTHLCPEQPPKDTSEWFGDTTIIW